MKLVGAGGQVRLDELYDASDTFPFQASIVALYRSVSRTHLMLQNTGSSTIWAEFGPARARAAVSGGVVTSVTVTNAGQNYTYPPTVEFLGGGGIDMPYGNTAFLGINQPDAPSPSRPAQAHCVMTGAPGSMSISSIVIDDPGAGYASSPYVYIRNSPNDPIGCAVAAPNTGFRLDASTPPLIWNGTACPTTQMSLWGDVGASFTLKYMP